MDDWLQHGLPKTSEDTPERPDERRRFPRTRCFKGAKIVAPGHASVACIVRNISAEGARLQLSEIVGLPDAFDLCFDSGRRVQQCRVMWRTAKDAGIWFAEQALAA